MFEKILVGQLEDGQSSDALALGERLATATGAALAAVTAPDAEGNDLRRIARLQGADLLVLGPHVSHGIHPATVDRLLGDPPCAIAVAPPGFAAPNPAGSWHPLDGHGDDPGLRVVGVGYDGSPAARAALELATELALRNNASMRVYTVAGRLSGLTPAGNDALTSNTRSETDALRSQLAAAVRELPSEARALPIFLRGFDASELIAAAKLGVDLLVLGARPGGTVRRWLHKSVTGFVLAGGVCPVLIMPTTVAAEAASPA